MDEVAYTLIKAGLKSIDEVTDTAIRAKVQALLDADNA